MNTNNVVEYETAFSNLSIMKHAFDLKIYMLSDIISIWLFSCRAIYQDLSSHFLHCFGRCCINNEAFHKYYINTSPYNVATIWAVALNAIQVSIFHCYIFEFIEKLCLEILKAFFEFFVALICFNFEIPL